MGLQTDSALLGLLLSTLPLVLSLLQSEENVPLEPLHFLQPELCNSYHHCHPLMDAILSMAVSRWRL